MAKIFVKPIPKENRWHGLKNPTQEFAQPVVYEVLYDPDTGRYDTGLTEEEREKYEKLLGVNLDPTFEVNKPHPYFSTERGKMKLPYQTKIFDSEKPVEWLLIKFMKQSPFVANSLKEFVDDKWPQATHYIVDEMGEVEVRASAVQLRNQCILTAAKMTLDTKIDMVRIFSENPVNTMSQDFVDVQIDEIISNRPKEFMEYASLDREQLNIRSTIVDAIHRNVLVKEGTAVYYMGERLAGSIDETITWFLDPQNSVQKLRILEQLQA